MNVLRNRVLLVAASAACLLGSTATAEVVVPGDFQSEIGAGSDWTLENAPAMNDLGGGLFDLPLTGLAPNTRYGFKGVNAMPTPVAWGNGEIPDNGPGSPNNWLLSDGNGEATLMLDRNPTTDGFSPATDRFTVSTDFTEFSSFFATGDWQTEAGGAGDFVPNDPLFEMAAQGGGLYTLETAISTPGTYAYKALGNGSFDFQWGANGRLFDAANLSFETTQENQPVVFSLDISKGAIRADVIPEPTALALLGLGAAGVGVMRRRR